MKFLVIGVAIGVTIGFASDLLSETTPNNTATKSAKEAAVQKAKAEDKQKGFHCLSGWDGSHRAVVSWVKNNLKDPDSYQHKQTRITPAVDGVHLLAMEYRAKNSFGGYVIGTVTATVDNASCSASIIGSNG
jgi:hypothetical protein